MHLTVSSFKFQISSLESGGGTEGLRGDEKINLTRSCP
ncbi:Uncharacterized protein dnm_099420 [Desulfonema magnum]|uniref:Uncharacterized protein n=1 Tax=Desulfonema magnum TaxID=45655 RepID=A0A975C0U3_9BACT|nr:Uncharacterized protein dnm_099420 [Desulfonema magnum]